MAPRGRPPKKVVEKVHVPIVTKLSSDYQSTSSVKSYKEPPKVPAPVPKVEEAPKRPVGRPRKYPKVEKPAPVEVPLGEKRGRGRPRKSQPGTTAVATDSPAPTVESTVASGETSSSSDVAKPQQDVAADDHSRSSMPSAGTSSSSTSTDDVSHTMTPHPQSFQDDATDVDDDNESNFVLDEEEPISDDVDEPEEEQPMESYMEPSETYGQYNVFENQSSSPFYREPIGELPEQILEEEQYDLPGEFPQQVPGEPYKPEYRIMEDHNYALAEKMEPEEESQLTASHIEEIMEEILPAKKHRKLRQQFRHQVYTQIHENEMEFEALRRRHAEEQALDDTELLIPKIEPEEPQELEGVEDTTGGDLVKTTPEQERALNFFMQQKSKMCLRDIHNIASTVGLSVEFVTLWLQHNMQNTKKLKASKVEYGQPPIKLKLHALIPQHRNRKEHFYDNRYGEYFIPATTPAQMSDPNARRTQEELVSLYCEHLRDQVNAANGSSSQPSDPKKKLLGDWRPSKYGDTEITVAVLMNSDRDPSDETTLSERIEKSIDSVIHGFSEEKDEKKREMRKSWQDDETRYKFMLEKNKEEREMQKTHRQKETLSNRRRRSLSFRERYPDPFEKMIPRHLLERGPQHFYHTQPPSRSTQLLEQSKSKSGLPNIQNYASQHQMQSNLQKRKPDDGSFAFVHTVPVNDIVAPDTHSQPNLQESKPEYHNFETLVDAPVKEEWPAELESKIPKKILPESGELFLPTTGTLDIDMWTVDQVCQWSEFFLKADARRELRKNGVDGFALRQLFMEDSKYWLATEMKIGDIQLLKLHTAKVINSLNGY